MEKQPEMTLTTMLGHNSGKGSVVVRWGQYKSDLMPEHARQVGRQFMEAAEAAEYDELFVRFFVEHFDATTTQALVALGEFRKLRESLDPEVPAVDIPPGMITGEEKS